MTATAQEHQIGDVGGAVGLPWLHMVGLAPVDTGTAADTAPVAGDQRHPLGPGGRTMAAADEDRPARPVEQHPGEGGVAGQHLEKRLGNRSAATHDRCEPRRIRRAQPPDVGHDRDLMLGVGRPTVGTTTVANPDHQHDRIGSALGERSHLARSAIAAAIVVEQLVGTAIEVGEKHRPVGGGELDVDV